MENTKNENYGTADRNFQEEEDANNSEDSKLHSYQKRQYLDDFNANDPEDYYNNDKNSDPQKSEFTSEAAESNKLKHDDNLEDLEDFDDIELDANREDFTEVENLDDLDEDDLDEDDDFDHNKINNRGYSSN